MSETKEINGRKIHSTVGRRTLKRGAGNNFLLLINYMVNFYCLGTNHKKATFTNFTRNSNTKVIGVNFQEALEGFSERIWQKF